MARTRARSPRGQRAVCKTPAGLWKVLSTIAALTTQGMLGFGSFDGATDTETFLAFVREGLVPNLRKGQVAVLNNLSAHKSSEVDRFIESAGTRVMRLPPYSPDYNPMEMAISEIKSLLRKLAPREVDALLKAIEEAIGSITAEDAVNFIRRSRYSATSK